ncbi:hypothetical protein [Streptomyces sp. AC555_RSS877]|uniref:ATP-dependent DNA ligase n=1 Tax=Streptomyces sp. AC555_RSS877 TaxID=2823688 RepID=UPI0027E50378|nr:hypothetical protein [Streptomyces sp. AC555_RSS877]
MNGLTSLGHARSRRVKCTRHSVIDMTLADSRGQLNSAYPKWDGFRALVSVDAGRVVVRSRRGTEMGPSFPEVVAEAVQLPNATALDGELVVWGAAGRLAFERLQNRPARRGAGRPGGGGVAGPLHWSSRGFPETYGGRIGASTQVSTLRRTNQRAHEVLALTGRFRERVRELARECGNSEVARQAIHASPCRCRSNPTAENSSSPAPATTPNRRSA